jgi:hypothetical protein
MGLIVPTSAALHGQYGKRLKCNLCGTCYPTDHRARWERHVAKCADVHQGEMEEVIAKQRSNLFATPGDDELYAHVRKGGT